MNKKGFTLLEVTLFLAVSSGLAVIAIIGLAPRLRNVRFTQSVRGVESTINSEFAASAVGQNNRPNTFACDRTYSASIGWYPKISNSTPSTAGSSKDCVINGALVVFATSSMKFYSVVSLREPVESAGTCSDMSFEVVRECFKPRIARGMTSPLTEPPELRLASYQNGVQAESSLQGSGKPLAFGVIQNPNGTERYQFFHLSGDEVGTTQPQLNSTNTTDSIALVSKPYVCLKLSGRSAKINFSIQTSKPTVVFGECSV